MKNFKEFEQRISVVFKDIHLLQQAFTHRSYLNEHKHSALKHNERLEFLGDAVLELIVTEHLFEKYPAYTEGDMTSLRASLVNADTLSEVASALGMNDFLLLSHGEAKDTGRARRYILANTFEAVVGAIFIDQGYAVVRDFVAKSSFHLLDEIVAKGLWTDSKSLFQEKAQEIVGVTPLYKTVREEGPDHDKEFVVGVYLNTTKVAEGSGKSKQDAEQSAARAGLKAKGWE
ncbi:MAG: ribonuclease III [Candidatus Taylorbacteria bacterium RIFCSPHIGHO2_01_FULL_46_22b]|uniref:Ribonuclease 3 n=1 Tax=Candidatus Taylorbacteria bacterium RIFCSPHIGHO2_01_FULL_46_22b TaxID=1802301 RepID=A0A1G2M3Y9_9BACT|nr:MAG: ribonuclease III [Candidatus Taylorbacteria bacterium RIFCSPHIGHO2_01_FULL_46_22b]